MPVKIPDSLPFRVFVRFVRKGRMNAEIYQSVLTDLVGPSALPFQDRALYMDDKDPSHCDAFVTKTLCEIGLPRLQIDFDCTPIHQPLDQGINKSFVDRYSNFLDEYLRTNEAPEGAEGWRNLVIALACRALASIDTQTIAHAFKKCGLGVALDGSEDGQVNCLIPDRGVTVSMNRAVIPAELNPSPDHIQQFQNRVAKEKEGEEKQFQILKEKKKKRKRGPRSSSSSSSDSSSASLSASASDSSSISSSRSNVSSSTSAPARKTAKPSQPSTPSSASLFSSSVSSSSSRASSLRHTTRHLQMSPEQVEAAANSAALNEMLRKPI